MNIEYAMRKIGFLGLDNIGLELYKKWERVVFPEVQDQSNLVITVNSPPNKNYWSNIVDYANQFEHVTVIFKLNPEGEYQLAILSEFKNLWKVWIKSYLFDDFKQFEYIPRNIVSLHLHVKDSKRFSLAFLSDFSELKELHLESHSVDIEVITELTDLEILRLKSVSLPSAIFLGEGNKLKILTLKLGGMPDLSEIQTCQHLEKLELWAVNRLVNVDVIARLLSLKVLRMDQLSQLRDVCSLTGLEKLNHLRLARMKRLESLQWAAEIPNLQTFSIEQTTHLGLEAFRPFIAHKSLKYANIYIGRKHSAPVRELLGLPEIERRHRWSEL